MKTWNNTLAQWILLLITTIYRTLIRWGWLWYIVEPTLVKFCPSREKRILALWGWVVCLNHLILAIACIEIGQLIFGHWLSVSIVSVLLFLGISAMYRLLLTTFSSDRLPHTEKIDKVNSSLIISFFFLGFISLLVSKPLELMLFEPDINVYLEQYRVERAEAFQSTNIAFMDKEINLLSEQLNDLEIKSFSLQEITDVKKQINELSTKKQNYIREFEIVNNQSKYLVARFVLLSKHFPFSWFISLITLILYLLPFLGKVFWFKNGTYQIKCDNADLELIMKNYFQFETEYKSFFKKQFNVEVNVNEDFLNPPFNKRRRIEERSVLNREVFRNRLSQNTSEV